MEWRLVPKKKPPGLSKEEAEKPDPNKTAPPASAPKPPRPKLNIPTPSNYGPPGNPHDQFIADLIQGLHDGTILLRSVDARRVTSHPYTELMVELLDTGLPPGVLPSAVAAHTGVKAPTGPTGAVGATGPAPGITGATGPAPAAVIPTGATQTVHHLGRSVTSVAPVSSSAMSMSAQGGMVGRVAALPGAKSYGLKQSASEEPIVGYRDFKLIQGLYRRDRCALSAWCCALWAGGSAIPAPCARSSDGSIRCAPCERGARPFARGTAGNRRRSCTPHRWRPRPCARATRSSR